MKQESTIIAILSCPTMTVRVLILATRKPGLDPEKFKAHYDGTHVPLVQELTGSLFPLSHTRWYVERKRASDASTVDYPASVISGDQNDFPFDAVSELVFEDMEAYRNFNATLMQDGIMKKVQEDCKEFLDIRNGTPMVVLSGCSVSTREINSSTLKD